MRPSERTSTRTNARAEFRLITQKRTKKTTGGQSFSETRMYYYYYSINKAFAARAALLVVVRLVFILISICLLYTRVFVQLKLPRIFLRAYVSCRVD